MDECKLCGDKGLVLRIDVNGLCNKCEDHVSYRVIPAAKRVQRYFEAANTVKTVRSKITNYDTAIVCAVYLLPYEEKGIPTCEPLPSAFIKLATKLKDEVIKEELLSIYQAAQVRILNAKTPKGVAAAYNAGQKKLRDISLHLYDQSLADSYIEALENKTV